MTEDDGIREGAFCGNKTYVVIKTSNKDCLSDFLHKFWNDELESERNEDWY